MRRPDPSLFDRVVADLDGRPIPASPPPASDPFVDGLAAFDAVEVDPDLIPEVMPPMSGPCQAADWLISRGFKPVPVRGKIPCAGDGWGSRTYTPATFREEYRTSRADGVGVLLGPGMAPCEGRLIDLEGDGPEAEASIRKLMGGDPPPTLGWTSTRGSHRLYVADDRFVEALASLAGKPSGKGTYTFPDRLPGLEFRVGGARPDGSPKMLQSVCPPSRGDDGKPRRWIGVPTVSRLPLAALDRLDRAAARPTADPSPRRPEPAPKPTKPFAATVGDSTAAYARAALDRECGDVATAPEGGRNERLNVAAFKLGSLAGAGALDEREAVAGLEAAARRAGLADHEAAATIRSGMEAGKATPRDLSDVGTRARPSPPDAPTGGAGDPPMIEIGPDQERVVDEVLAALARDGRTYRSGTQLVSIVPADGDAPASIRTIAPPTLRERIASAGRLVKPIKRGDVCELVWAHPPDWLVSTAIDRKVYPGFRELRGIVTAPTIRPDGSILDRPGYDPATRLVYTPNRPFDAVPEHPTAADARAAVGLLYDVVGDFPWRSVVDTAGWLAALLTHCARAGFEGPSPLFGLDASTRGAGKGLLMDVTAIIATGARATTTAYPSGRNGDEEMEKRVTSFAVEGRRMVVLDNIDGPLGGAALDVALTSSSWGGRLLGKSESVTLPLSITWLATGNNLAARGDTARRVLFARIEPVEERPEERTGFKYPNLIAHVREHRGALLPAALTIIRAWHVAGRPKVVEPLGSFEGWTRAICDPIAWATGVNPLDARKFIQADDDDAAMLAALVSGWASLPGSEAGLTTHEAYRLLNAPGHEDRFPELRTALAAMARDGGMPTVNQLGNRLRHVKGRVVGGLRIEPAGKLHNATRWRAAKLNAPTP